MAKLKDMTIEELQLHLQNRYKKQNEKTKENFDRVSAILPQGTKERIKAIGMPINGFVKEAVLKLLDEYENAQEKQTSTAMPDGTKARVYKNITGKEMPESMREKPEPVKIVQLEKSPDSVIFDGLEVSPERVKEIQEKLDQQLKAKEEQEKQTPKRDSFADTLERLRKDNQDGQLALNVREDI